MNHTYPKLKVTPFLIAVFFFTLVAHTELFAQLTATQARHETVNQNSTTIRLSGNLGANYSLTAGWSVTVGGAAVTILNVFGGATTNTVTITWSIGQAVDVGEAVVVNFAGDAFINSIPGMVSENNKLIACTDFQFAANIGSSLPCAPVDPKTTMVFSVTKGARNSSFWNVSAFDGRVYWQADGSGPQSTIDSYESDIGGSAAANSYFIAVNSDNDPTDYNYPSNETVCGYTSYWYIMRNSAVCTSQFDPSQRVTYASYNTDALGEGDGQLITNPVPATGDQVCEGQPVNMYFNDASNLNCIDIAAAPDPLPLNQLQRWVRVIYGFPHDAGNTIRNVEVGGEQITDANGDLLPAFMGGYIPTVANALGTPDAFGVVNFPALVTGPAGQLEQITSTATLEGDAGRTFNITLQYWNVCNEYDDAGDAINGNAREITDQVIIINAPVAPNFTPDPAVFCNNATNATYTFTAAGTGGTYTWYRDALLSDLEKNGNTFNPVTEGTPAVNKTVAGNYTYYLTETLGNGCTSPPTEVDFTIRNNLAQPSAFTGPTNVCPNSTYTWTMPSAPATETFGGTTEFVWTYPASWTFVSQTATEITLTTSGTSGNLSVVRRYTSNPQCGSTARTTAITVRARPTVNITPDPVDICEGNSVLLNGNPSTSFGTISSHTWGGNVAIIDDPAIQQPTILSSAAPGAYNLTYFVTADFGNGVFCSSVTDDIDVDISANTAPALTGADQPLCGTLTSDPMGGSNPAPGIGTWTFVSSLPVRPAPTISNINDPDATITIIAGNEGEYTMRWTVLSGTCTSQADIIVDFGSDPTDPDAGILQNVCGESATLAGNTPVIGSGVWSVVSGPACVGVGCPITITTPTSPTSGLTLNGPGFTYGAYTLRWTITSGICPSEQDDVQIIFNPPATSTPGAGFTTCVDPLLLDPINLSGTVGGGATGGRWERVTGTGLLGNGTAVGDTDLGVTVTDEYTPTAADIISGTIQVRLVASGATAPCPEVSNTITITIDRRPTGVDAGAAQPFVCAHPVSGLGSTTLAATALATGETGAWSGPGGVTFGTIGGPTSTVSNLPVGTTTLTWTVTSPLGNCATVPDQVDITVNALPDAIDPTPNNLCEVVEASGVALGVDITQYNDDVTGIAGSTNRTIEWYTNVARTPIFLVPNVNSHDISNGLTLFTRVYDDLTNCFRDGTVTFTVNPLPLAADQAYEFCEEFPAGSDQVQNIDLTSAAIINPITGGVANRTIVWFNTLADANANTNAIPGATAASYDVLSGSETVFARVTNTITTCVNIAEVDLVVKPRPVDPTITGSDNQCLNGFDLYSVTPVAGVTYIWDVDDNAATEFDVIAGGAPTDFLVVLSFPNVYSGDIRLTLDRNGCQSNQVTKTVTVQATPPPVTIIASKDPVCASDAGIQYTATSLPLTDYTWDIPVVGGATGSSIIGGQGSNMVTVNVGTISGNIRVTPQTQGGSCAGSPATFFIDVRERPVLDTYPITPICSDDAIGITLQEAAGSVVPASYQITNVTVAPGLNPSSRALATGGANLIMNDSYTNVGNGNTPLDVRYTIVPISTEGCEGSPKDITVRILPEPVINPNLDRTVCSREVSNIVLQVASNSAPADRFEVTLIENLGGLVPLAGNPAVGTNFLASELADDVWENTTGVTATIRYFIRPVNTATGCIGDPPYPILLIVNPEPIVTPTSDVICSGDMPSITLASSIPASTFDWSVKSITGLITGGGSGSGSTITNVLINNDVTPGSITYEVFATGPGGALGTCQSQPIDVTITVNPAPTAINVDQIVCSDASGGNTFTEDLQALESSVNSSGTVTFLWYEDLGKTQPIVAPQLNAWPLANGIPVYVDVFNGQCRILHPVTYTVNPTPSVTASITSNYNGFNVSCAGSSNGTITSDLAAQGTPNYLYSIDGGTSFFTSRIFNGLSALGNPYVITVRDSKGCISQSAPMNLLEPPALTATTAISSNHNGQHVSCPGEDDGEITVTPVGGVAPYVYQILELPGNTTGNASGVYTGLRAGTYTVFVRDANTLCTVTTNTVTLVDPPTIVATATLDNPASCNGDSDGQISVIASGGTLTGLVYTYTLNQAPFTVNTTGIFTGLAAGPYSVTVEDDNGCTQVSNTITVTQPSVLTAFASVTSNYNGAKISCPGASDAQITVIANGGNGTFTYVLVEAPANISGQVDGTFDLVGPGTYTVTVTDLLLCSVTTTAVTITEPTVINASGLVSNPISCNGNNDGEITISGTGGTGAYSFEQIAPAGPTNATGIFSGLLQGVYDFEVSDLNGCSDVVQVTLNEPTVVTASASVTSNYNGSQISCNGNTDAAITVTASGGTGAFRYVFDQIPGNTTGEFTGVFTGVPANTGYTFSVEDANNCPVVTAPVDVIAPTVINVTTAAVTSNYNGQDISCTGVSDAEITIIVTGGTTTVPGPTGYTYRLDQEPLNTSGNVNGVYTGISVGSYTVTVRDVNNCFIATVPIVIDPYPAITVPASVTSSFNGGRQISCNGANDGEITVVPAGGVAPFTFVINPAINASGLNSGVFTGLVADTYTITAADINGCPRTTSPVTITEPALLTASAAVTSNYNGEEISCNGASDGIINVTATGGTTVYSYILNEIGGNVSGASSGSFSGVPAGASYTITVSDVNLCSTVTTPISVSQPLALVVSGGVTSNYNGEDISCNGANDAIIAVSFTVGTGTGTPTYEFDSYPAPGNVTGKFSGIFTNVQPNAGYTITGTDVNGCTAQTVVIPVTEPLALGGGSVATSDYNGFDVSCFNETDGEITVTSIGGTGNPLADFNYVLLEASSNISGVVDGTFDNLRAGTYRVRITDQNGCIFTTPVIPVIQPTDISIAIDITSNYGVDGTDISCVDAADGQVSVRATISGGAGLVGGGAGSGLNDYTYLLDPDAANTTGNLSGVFTGLTDILYTVIAEDANGCTKESLPVVLIEPIPLYEGYVGSSHDICINQDNPEPFTIVTDVFGGNGSYIYQWQESTSATGPFADIGGATSDVFQAPALPALTQTMHYRRIVSTAGSSVLCPSLPSNVLTITVNELPTATIENQPAVCQGSPFLLDFTFPDGAAPFTFTYNDGVNPPVNRIGGTVTPIFVPDYQQALTYTITSLVDGKGCIALLPIASYTVPLIDVDADFTITSPNPQCSGSQFTFAYNADPGVEYTFMWPDGTTDVLTPGTGTVDKILTSFNSDTNSDLPVVLTATHPLCAPLTTSELITIFPAIIPNVVTNPTTMCSGTPITITNLTQGGDDHDWRIVRMSDGVEVHSLLDQANPDSQTFTINNDAASALNPDNYEIRYTINNSAANGACSDQVIVPVRVYREVIASFTKPVPAVWSAAGVDMVFTNTSTPVSTDFEYSWTFVSDATPAAFVGQNPPTIHYSEPGLNKRVTLVASNPTALADPLLLNGCQSVDEYVFSIIIPPLTANFTRSPEGACLPTTIVITSNTSTGDVHEWKVRNQSGVQIYESGEVMPTFPITTPGEYTISLTTRSSLSAAAPVNAADQTVSVYAYPIAVFEAQPTVLFVPDEELRTFNSSVSPTDPLNPTLTYDMEYRWYFGDGTDTVYSETEPRHFYQNEGNYDVALLAINDHGNGIVCIDTLIQRVQAKAQGFTKIPNAFTPNPAGPNGGYDNGSVSRNDVFLPIMKGVKEFQMQIFDRWGNLVFESKETNRGWDGYDRNGALLPAGVYVYKLVLRLANDQRTTQIGDVTMIR